MGAPETAETLAKACEDRGFTVWQMGGGCVAYGNAYGVAQVLVTSADGCDLPEPANWLVGAYHQDEGEHRMLLDGIVDGLSIDQALQQAIEKAESIAREAAAPKPGDLD